MRRYRVFISALILAAFSVSSCHDKVEYDPERLKDNAPVLVVDGEEQFRWDALTCQESFNPGRAQFRVGTDNMSDYFVLTLSEVPSDVGQIVRGALEWTTDIRICHLGNLPFEVMKLASDGTIWLWNSDEAVSVTVRALE